MLSGPARSESGAVPSSESAPSNVAMQSVNAMPSELAPRSANAPTESRSRLRIVSAGKQSSPARGASVSGRQATGSRVESAPPSGARNCVWLASD